MNLKDGKIDYSARWDELDAFIANQPKATSIEMRWQQMNSIFSFAVASGLNLHKDIDYEVINKWAKLKEKAERQNL